MDGKLNGKPTDTSEYKLSPDGKRITITYKTLKSDNKPMVMVWDRKGSFANAEARSTGPCFGSSGIRHGLTSDVSNGPTTSSV